MLIFAEVFMKKYVLFLMLLLVTACTKPATAHPPVGGFLSERDMQTSKNRAKNLNQTERTQIQDWINSQKEAFYPMSMNYWVNVKDLSTKTRKQDGERVSYQYDLYDFDHVKLYDHPIEKKEVQLGKFEELKAVEDVVRYLDKNQEATLLVPSVLAFGTYGDNKKIPNDMPLIIQIKMK